MGEARKSISDFYLPTYQNGNEPEVTQAQKRPRTDHLEVPPIVLGQSSDWSEVSSESAETVVPMQEPPLSNPIGSRNAIRHDRLLDKIDRYKSHNEFIRKCIASKIIPLSYKVTVEPSIGNHDEEFLKGYYDLLDGFSKQLMEYTADYCVKKREEFENQQKTSEEELKASTTTQGFSEMQKTFEINRNKRLKSLQEIKDKKFIRLKYKSQHQTRDQFYSDRNANNDQKDFYRPHQTTPQQNQPRYGHLSRKNSSSNLGDRGNNRNQISNNSTNQAGFTNKIDDLERQLKALRQESRSYSQAVKNTNYREDANPNQAQRTTNGNVINDKFVSNKNQRNWERNNTNNHNQNATNPNLKNAEPSHSAHGESSRNQNEQATINTGNVEVSEVLEYISTAMQTLGDFEKRFKQRMCHTMTPSEM